MAKKTRNTTDNDTAMAAETGLVVQDTTTLPDHLRHMTGSRGSEAVGGEDMVIPRLEIAQAISPCLKKNDPAYIEGIEQGDMYNNVTREVYGRSLVVVPVMFVKEWLLWKDRKKGGGFFGAFPSEQAAIEARLNLDGEDPSDIEVVDTAQHYCPIVTEQGEIQEIVISMSKSKMKVSRQWNSLIRMNGGDRFSRAYRLTTVEDTNRAGDDFWNYRVQNMGYASEPLYRRAEELYEAIAKGSVHINREQDIAGTFEEGEEEM